MSVLAHAAGTVHISTWNMQWLSSVPTKKMAESQRQAEDVAKMAFYFQQTQADILAFQEVNDIKAIQQIVGADYHVRLSDRASPPFRRHQFDDINQYTGFAIKKEIPFEDPQEIVLDTQANSKLRFAAYVIIKQAPYADIHLLNVHLKAGCSGAFKTTEACQTLKRQGKQLAKWIKSREAQKQHYVILGDFNHNLAYAGDWLYEILADSGQFRLASQHSEALCQVRSKRQPSKTHRFRSLIDHILVSHSLTSSEAKQTRFDSLDVLRFQLSDHCPLSSTLTLNHPK
ncbi:MULTISPECIES: endonuclease/exonuclease/phosphatase family protein [Vibrio]|uniref:endonuclease/exonuclease/phosphatase family protein n=1 Tax=Vibrio TaxID=662 RepID=UPI001D04AD91|nr:MULTISPECIES: endonuclease/exonuclease/phosphatase family protein [Vibrio]